MIKQTVNFSQFCDSFGGSYKDNFSYEGKRALFDYLEQYSEEVGEDIELDPIALCCEYTEYDNLKDLQEQYPNIESEEDLLEKTAVIPVEGSEGFIILNY
jgi:hypothetical protein